MDRPKQFWETFKPSVSKNTLLLTAGAVWLATGSLMNTLSWGWLRAERCQVVTAVYLLGFTSALMVHHFGFLRLVDRNLRRILAQEGRKCFFSFIPWKSYLLVMVMAGTGFLLRHSPFPKPWLAAVYLTIGTALILSSLRYFRTFLGCRHGGEPPLDA
jgi:hypothetical protein